MSRLCTGNQLPPFFVRKMNRLEGNGAWSDLESTRTWCACGQRKEAKLEGEEKE